MEDFKLVPGEKSDHELEITFETDEEGLVLAAIKEDVRDLEKNNLVVLFLGFCPSFFSFFLDGKIEAFLYLFGFPSISFLRL